jgi:hypothetical protein
MHASLYYEYGMMLCINRQQRQHKEQAGREASWLKEVRKVKRVGESEKWVTRPRGRSKKICSTKKRKRLVGG